MHSVTLEMKKAAAFGGRAAQDVRLQGIRYRDHSCLSSRKPFCRISDCIEPPNGDGLCAKHHRAYCIADYRRHRTQCQGWANAERERQINELLAVSTPLECKAIERGRREGRKLRRELEAM